MAGIVCSLSLLYIIEIDTNYCPIVLICVALEKLSRTGLEIRCADGLIRSCYPIIAGFMVDYPEQCLLTAVKYNQHCSICQVPPNSREMLEGGPWLRRTHQSTQAQIEKQQRENIKQAAPAYVHPVHNFAWNHNLANIHDAMMVDVLHQLLKGIVMRLIGWVKGVIAEVISPETRLRRDRSTIADGTATEQLDARFRQVPAFPGLKMFTHFSAVAQWTGAEQKAMLQQLVSVVAPLLSKKAPAAMLCTRAIIDFVTLARYRTHDSETLRYMQHALHRIDVLKIAFRSQTKQGNFNYPKFHVMSHYMDFISRFGCTEGTDTDHSESAHKYLIKDYYDRTNKRADFEEQILLHNERREKMNCLEAALLLHMANPTALEKNQLDAQVTQPSAAMDLSVYHELDLCSSERAYMKSLGLDINRWRPASSIADKLQVHDLVPALAVFVRNSRAVADGLTLSESELGCVDEKPSWAARLPICVHASITSWVAKGKDAINMDAREKEFIRCAPAWQTKKLGTWRRDFAWVQGYKNGSCTRNGRERPMQGRLVGQILITVTVVDIGRCDPSGKPLRYSGSMVELWRPRNHGRPDIIHGMIEVEKVHLSQPLNSVSQAPRKIFDMCHILRSVHLVPARREANHEVCYINNYIDWEQFNDQALYSQDWLAEGTRIAEEAAEKIKREESKLRR